MKRTEDIPIDQFPTQRLGAIAGPAPGIGPPGVEATGIRQPMRPVTPYPYQRLETITAIQKRLLNSLLAASPRVEDSPILDAIAGRLAALLARGKEPEPWELDLHLVAPAAPDLCWNMLRHGFLTMVHLPPGRERALVAIDPVLTRAVVEAIVDDYRTEAAGPALKPGRFEGGIVTAALLAICQHLTSLGFAPFSLPTAQVHPQELDDWLEARRGTLIEAMYVLGKTHLAGTPSIRGGVRVFFDAAFVGRLIDGKSETPALSRLVELPFAGIPLEATITLATVAVPVREVIRLRPGDLLLPACHGLRAEALRPCEGSGRLEFGKRGHVTCLLRPGEEQWQVEIADIHHEEEKGMKHEEQGEGDEATMAMAATVDLEVEVRIGRFPTTVGELARLKRGMIIELDVPVASPVELVVDGQRMGQGELVIIEGHLGVRILNMGKGRS